MAKTIGTLAYRIVADTKGFSDGMTATRKEMYAAKQIIEQTTSPADKLAQAYQNLERLQRKGLLTESQLAQAKRTTRDEILGVTDAVIVEQQKVESTRDVLAKYAAGITAAVVAQKAWQMASAAVSAAIATVTENVRHQLEAIDDLLTESKTIGISAASFQKLGYAAKLSDIEIGDLSNGMKAMLANVSKADMGSAKLVKVFDMLGLSASELKAMQPERQVEAITRAIAALPDQADKVRAATAIFGSADFLRFDTEGLSKANDLFEEMGGAISSLEATAFGQFDESLDGMNQRLDIAWKRVTFALLPALNELIDTGSTGLTNVAGRNQVLIDSLEDATDAATGLIAVLREVPQQAVNTGIGGALRSHFAAEIEGAKALLGPLHEIGQAKRREMELNADLARSVESRRATETDAINDEVQELERLADTLQGVRDSQRDLVASLQDEIATFGMSAEQIQIHKLAQQGATIETLVMVAALQKQKAELEKTAAAKRKMEAYHKAAKAAALKEIEDEIAAEERKKEAKKESPLGPSAMLAGSQEAIKFALEWSRKSAASASAEKAAERSAATLDKILFELRGGVVETTVVGSL